MRLKILLSFLIILCAYDTYGSIIKETHKITNKEWHCRNICKSCYGEPYFDKINDKCYCSLRKGNSIEDRTCRDEMKLNAEVHDINLIIKETSNRVRREEPEIEKTIPETDTNQFTNTATEKVIDAAEPILTEEKPKSTTNVPIIDTTIKVNENINNIVAAANTKTKSGASKNIIERKPRPFQKIAAVRKSGDTQNKQIDDLVAEAQQKVEEFVVIHRKNPKEAHSKIKDIQGTFNKVASRLKHNTSPPTLIVEPENLGEINPEENTNDAIIGSRKHPIHRSRYPLSRRVLHNEENSHLKPRLSHNEHEENTRPRSRLFHINENEDNIRSRSRFTPRPRLRDRVIGAKNPTETTTQVIENNKEIISSNNETVPKNTETTDNTKIDEVLKTNIENEETNPVNNEI